MTMKRAIAIGIGLALAIVVLVSAGVCVLTGKINDGLQRNCNHDVISQYEAVRDSIASEISEAVIQRYDCEDGGYSVLEFHFVGDRQAVLGILQCSVDETWPTDVVYGCGAPKAGFLEVKDDGGTAYNFGS
jgi:hypothetical protein